MIRPILLRLQSHDRQITGGLHSSAGGGVEHDLHKHRAHLTIVRAGFNLGHGYL
jgi:hypothetical protein